MQSSAVHPAFTQHCLELFAEGRMDGFFGWQQVAVGDRLLALHWGPQGGTRLLEDIGAHVLHDGAHYDHAGEIVEENDVTLTRVMRDGESNWIQNKEISQNL